MRRGKLSEIQNAVSADGIALRGNVLQANFARKGIFYDSGVSAETLRARVLSVYADAQIVKTGETMSGWWVRFTLPGVHDSSYKGEQ